jgi:S1-C subfamily serine protease
MAKSNHWAFPSDMQPKAEDVRFDLAAALRSVVMLRAEIPADAYTAEILGTERFGNGVVIRDDGLILTIGYLITEAESIWLTANDGTVVPGHPLGYDFASGFGLVLPLGRLGAPPLPVGSAAPLAEGDEVSIIGRGGRSHALAARIFAKREFAGYWEYVLDEALFTTPAHPEWSGAALVDADGRLAGIGSLYMQEMVGEEEIRGNMFVPVDLLAPILDDLVKHGRSTAPPRPWLGMYTVEMQGRLVVNALADRGPAEVAQIQPGDVVTEVAGQRIGRLPDLFRAIWRQGPAGTEIPLTLVREGVPLHVMVRSADRTDFFRKPSLQ